MNWLAQFFGFLGLCAIVTSMQIKDRKKSLIGVGIANLLFGINFLLLEAGTGYMMCFVSVVETIVLYMYSKREKDIPKYVIGLFVIFTLAIGIYTYVNIYSVFPIIAGIIGLFSLVTKNMKAFRILNMLVSLLWIVYDVVSGAYTSLLSHIISLIGVSIAVFRYDIKSKNSKLT